MSDASTGAVLPFPGTYETEAPFDAQMSDDATGQFVSPSGSNVEEFRLSNIWAELAAGARLIERRGSGDPLERKAIIASLVGSHEEAEHYIKLLMHRNRTGIRVVDTDPSARILTRSVS